MWASLGCSFKLEVPTAEARVIKGAEPINVSVKNAHLPPFCCTMDAMQRFEDAFGPPDDDDNEVSGALSADKTQGAGSAKRDGGGSNLVGSRSKGSKEKRKLGSK